MSLYLYYVCMHIYRWGEGERAQEKARASLQINKKNLNSIIENKCHK